MRKYTIFLFLFLPFLIANSFAQKNDTIFISRILNDTPYHIYHVIFIDTNSSSIYKKQLIDFSFNSYDSSTYYGELKMLPKPKKIKITKSFPLSWIELFKYKGKYYSYSPSEPGYHFKFKINDSTTIDYTMEGPEPSIIKKVLFKKYNHLKIERKSLWYGNSVEIKIIDNENGIALFTFFNNDKVTTKKLMLDVTKINVFPTIVNYCETDKQRELEFEKINFREIKNNSFKKN